MDLSRREMWASLGVSLGASGLLLGLTPVLSQLETEPEEDLREIGTKSYAIVGHFLESWSSHDVNKIAEFVAEDIVYQFIDGMPLIKGKEAFVKFVAEYLEVQQRVEWVFRDNYAIGNIVINQRVYRFYSKSGKCDTHFKVVGLFILKDGKISEWKDYRLPGDTEKKEG